MLQSSSKGHGHDHGHDHGAEGHGKHEEHEETSEDGDSAEASSEGKDGEQDSESKSEEAHDDAIPEEDGKGDQKDGGDSERSEESDGGDDKQQDTPDTSDDESSKTEAHETGPGRDVEGVQFKGATKGGATGDTRKSIPDAKGGNKKRIESDAGMRQGVSDDEPTRDAEGSNKDKVRTMIST